MKMVIKCRDCQREEKNEVVTKEKKIIKNFLEGEEMMKQILKEETTLNLSCKRRRQRS